MSQELDERFRGLKVEAQKQITQAINILESAANKLVQLARVYPEDRPLSDRISDIIENEETGIRKRRDEFQEIVSTIASLEHIEV